MVESLQEYIINTEGEYYTGSEGHRYIAKLRAMQLRQLSRDIGRISNNLANALGPFDNTIKSSQTSRERRNEALKSLREDIATGEKFPALVLTTTDPSKCDYFG